MNINEELIELSLSKYGDDYFLRPANEKAKIKIIDAYLECKVRQTSVIKIALYNDEKSNEKLRTKKQIGFMKMCVANLVEKISDLQKVYTPEEIEYEVREEFYKYKFSEGIDLYQIIKMKDGDGNIVDVKMVGPFPKDTSRKIYSEYMSFFKNYIINKFSIDPFSFDN